MRFGELPSISTFAREKSLNLSYHCCDQGPLVKAQQLNYQNEHTHQNQAEVWYSFDTDIGHMILRPTRWKKLEPSSGVWQRGWISRTWDRNPCHVFSVWWRYWYHQVGWWFGKMLRVEILEFVVVGGVATLLGLGLDSCQGWLFVFEETATIFSSQDRSVRSSRLPAHWLGSGRRYALTFELV